MKSFVLGMFMFAQSPEHIHIFLYKIGMDGMHMYHTRYINMTSTLLVNYVYILYFIICNIIFSLVFFQVF